LSVNAAWRPDASATPRLQSEDSLSQELWSAVESYITDLLVPPDPALEAALEASAAAGLPAINVAPTAGKLLQLLARIQGARAILEIGTLGGYSTIWLARALPAGGRLITLEADPKHAEVARENIARAGLAASVEVRVGKALETLPAVAAEGHGPFDLVFIDADKPSNPGYFAWAMRLTRPGSLIIVDNVVRDGKVADQASADPSVIGVRRLNELIAAEPRVSATAIQTVGSKGYDGLAVILRTDA
jgi:predicted O-methyltransferase YrrM